MRTTRWKVAQHDSDFEPYLAKMPVATVEMFHRFISMARACGPVTFELQNGPVVLPGARRIFASVRPNEHGLSGHLNMLEQITDPRIVRVDQLTKRILFHTFRIGSTNELDDEFKEWLCVAWTVGERISRPA